MSGETADVAELQEQIADLQLQLAGQGRRQEYQQRIDRFAELGLTPLEARIAAAFNSPGVISKSKMFDALYWDRRETDEIPDIRIIDVYICKLRKKLAEMQIDGKRQEIKLLTLWGRGYQIDPTSYSIFQRLIEPKEKNDDQKERHTRQ